MEETRKAAERRRMTNSEKKNTATWYSFFQVVQVLLALSLPIVGWLFTLVIEMDKRLTRIEASRFTIEDGAKIQEQISLLRQDIAVYAPNGVRFTTDLLKIEKTLDSVNERLYSIERKVK